jgi:hypothetical protein
MDQHRRRTTKLLAALTFGTAALTGALVAHNAEASYFPAAMCSPITRGLSWSVCGAPSASGCTGAGGSVKSLSGSVGLRCAMPVNQQTSVVNPMAFTFRIWRDTGSAQTWCAGDAWDSSGNIIFQTAFATISGTAQKSTFQNLAPAAGPAALNTYTFSAQCGINTNDKLVYTRIGPA